jgi:hypothetical protein
MFLLKNILILKVESGFDIEYSVSNSKDEIIHSFVKTTDYYSINDYNKQHKHDGRNGKINYLSLFLRFLNRCL